MNTPTIETERLILRKFTLDDLEAIYQIYSDEEVNRFLPWFPLKSREQARRLFEEKYAALYAMPWACAYAICLKQDNLPIGYIQVGMEEPHDLGYGLRREFWHRGIVTEAAKAVAAQAKRDGLPYLTATHDQNNPRSGGVMQNIGMRYCYSYQEQWQPKDILVTFRLYQLNLDGREERVYRNYWDSSVVHFVEKLCPVQSKKGRRHIVLPPFICIGLEVIQCVDIFLLWLYADQALLLHTVHKEDDGRDAHDAELRGDGFVVVDVDLGDGRLAGKLLAQLIDDREQRLARHAPWRPKIDHHFAAGNGLVKVVCIQM